MACCLCVLHAPSLSRNTFRGLFPVFATPLRNCGEHVPKRLETELRQGPLDQYSGLDVHQHASARYGTTYALQHAKPYKPHVLNPVLFWAGGSSGTPMVIPPAS